MLEGVTKDRYAVWVNLYKVGMEMYATFMTKYNSRYHMTNTSSQDQEMKHDNINT